MANEPWTFTSPLCSEVGTEPFFLSSEEKDDNRVASQEDYRLAIKICKSCKHQLECAAWAIKHEAHGIWGGLTPSQRKKIRKQKNIIIDTELKTLG